MRGGIWRRLKLHDLARLARRRARRARARASRGACGHCHAHPRAPKALQQLVPARRWRRQTKHCPAVHGAGGGVVHQHVQVLAGVAHSAQAEKKLPITVHHVLGGRVKVAGHHHGVVARAAHRVQGAGKYTGKAGHLRLLSPRPAPALQRQVPLARPAQRLQRLHCGRRARQDSDDDVHKARVAEVVLPAQGLGEVQLGRKGGHVG